MSQLKPALIRNKSLCVKRIEELQHLIYVETVKIELLDDLLNTDAVDEPVIFPDRPILPHILATEVSA